MAGPRIPLAASRGLSRRRWPRIDSSGRIQAQVVGLDLLVSVRDVSLGGFAAEGPVRFAHGESHEFLLCCDGGEPVRARARAVYCHTSRDRTGSFITGWEALGDPLTTRAMAHLVDALTRDDQTDRAGAAHDASPRLSPGTDARL